ncbi:Iron-uptake system permease protein FeuC [compost metagenome]
MGSSSLPRYSIVIFGCSLFIVLFIILGLTTGEMGLSLREVLTSLLRLSAHRENDLVIFQFRLPRIALGALLGFGLGLAGSAVQSLTRNGLADPGILGINAGAGMFVVIFMLLLKDLLPPSGTAQVMLMPLFGMTGGLLASALIFLLSRDRDGINPQKLLLVGIAVSSGFSAVTLYASLKMNPTDFERAGAWLSGNLNSANWQFVASVLPWTLLLTPLLLSKTRTLDLFRMGDSSVVSLGVPVRRERGLLLLASVGLVSSGVAVAGSIGFVGLIAPHMAVRLTGLSHRRSLLVSGLLGAALVLAGDFIGRTIFSPAQLPVGIVLSVIGAPYFVWLLASRRLRT